MFRLYIQPKDGF